MHSSEPAANVLSAGYAQHRKPYRPALRIRPNGTLLRLQIRGRCRAIVNGAAYALEPGDLIVSRPGEPYQLSIDADAAAGGADGEAVIDSADYYLLCEGGWIEDWVRRGALPDRAAVGVGEEIVSLWRRIVFEKRNLRGNNAELLSCLLRALCLTIERALLHGGSGSFGRDAYLPHRIKQYIEQHATEPLTLAFVAQQHGVSPSTASHLFTRAFGRTMMRYAVDVRLSIAAERLLVSGAPLEDIAEAAGFRSYPYFCRAFRARYQMSPSDYRTHHTLV